MKRCFWIIPFIIPWVCLYAQPPSYHSTLYNIASGLPSNYIFDIKQDPSGFLWIATDKGLSRYDGRHFINYSRDEGLPANQIYSLTLQGNTVWMGTYGGGA